MLVAVFLEGKPQFGVIWDEILRQSPSIALPWNGLLKRDIVIERPVVVTPTAGVRRPAATA